MLLLRVVKFFLCLSQECDHPHISKHSIGFLLFTVYNSNVLLNDISLLVVKMKKYKSFKNHIFNFCSIYQLIYGKYL